jgi:hypothetical protein
MNVKITSLEYTKADHIFFFVQFDEINDFGTAGINTRKENKEWQQFQHVETHCSVCTPTTTSLVAFLTCHNQHICFSCI